MNGRVSAAALLAFILAAEPAAILAAGPAVAAVDVPTHIDAAKAAYLKGDVARAAHELEMALVDLQDRLGRGFSDFMPATPTGWDAEEAEIQGLGAVGGGLSITRAYTKGEASLNASIILDSPAVEAAGALLGNPAAQTGLKRIKLGSEDALLRWDEAGKSGEITIVMGNRVLLQIEGDSLANGDVLIDLAKGFNVAGIRKLAGV